MSNCEYYMIEFRKRTKVATFGSQRRVYNGCYHSSDWEDVWTKWSWLNLKLTAEEADRKLMFWKDLNSYAVKERGAGAEQQFRIVPDTVYDGTW